MGQSNRSISRTDLLGLAAAVALALLFFGVNLWLQIAKYQAFHWSCFDYANVAGLFEETLNGHFRYLDNTHIYALVLMPMLLPQMLVYLLFPGALSLMILHALFFASGVLLVYFAAKQVFRRPWAPLLFSFSLAFNPIYAICSLSGLRNAATILPAAFGAFIAWKARRKGWFIFCAAAICATQINFAVGLFALGFALYLFGSRDRLGRTAMLFSAAWLGCAVIVVVAFSLLTGIHLPAKMTHLSAFGGSFGDIVKGLFTGPGFFLAQLFYYQNFTLLLFFVPLLGLSFVRPAWLFGALPELAYIAVSAYGHVNLDPRTAWAVNLHDGWFSYFTTGFLVVLPFVYLAAIEGARRGADWLALRRPRLLSTRVGVSAAVAFILFTLTIHYFFTPGDYGPVPLTRHARFGEIVQTAHHRITREVLDSLPRNQSYLMTYTFYFFANDIANRTLVTRETPPTASYDRLVLDEQDPCPMTGNAFCRERLAQALADPRYETISRRDGIYVLARKK
jgi:uncharacterized membrane protein